MLAAHRERGLVFRAAAIERRRVLRRRPRVVMATAARGGGVADRQALERARGVGRQFEPLHGVHQIRRVRSHRRGQPPRALRQPIAETLTRRRHLDQPQHPAPVAPAERPADVRLREPATLERLGHEGQRHAHRDRVHAAEVAEVVGENERLGIVDAEHGPEGEDRLVLRHLRAAARELARPDRVLLPARHGTLQTRGVAIVVVRLHLFAADHPRVREHLGLEIEGAERAQRVDGADQKRRPIRRQRLGARGQRLARLVEQRLQRGRVGDGGLPPATDHDGLEVLAAEHGADAAASRDALAVPPVVRHRGEAHAPLTGGTDRDRVSIGALGGDECRHAVASRAAPERVGGLDRRTLFGHDQVRRRRRASGDAHRVEARALERGGQATAERRVEEEAGQRRLAGDERAAVARHGGIRDRADGEHDRIRGLEGVHARRHAIVENARREAVAAEQRARRRLGQRPGTRRPGCEIDEEEAAAVAVHGVGRGSAANSLRAASRTSAGRSLCASSFLYAVVAISGCLAAANARAAPSRPRRPVALSGAT